MQTILSEGLWPGGHKSGNRMEVYFSSLEPTTAEGIRRTRPGSDICIVVEPVLVREHVDPTTKEDIVLYATGRPDGIVTRSKVPPTCILVVYKFVKGVKSVLFENEKQRKRITLQRSPAFPTGANASIVVVKPAPPRATGAVGKPAPQPGGPAYSAFKTPTG